MWLDIEIDGVKPIYQINENGEVRNKKSNKILKQKITKNGYAEVSLIKFNNKLKSLRVHRLVMLTFPCIRYTSQIEVNHKDCNKLNNKRTNLEWCTPKENKQHARDNDLFSYRGEKNPQSKFTDTLVDNICKLLQKEETTEQIITTLNLQDTKSIRKLINRVRSRDGWCNISKNYKWVKAPRGGNNLKNKKYVEGVKQMLEANKSYDEIMRVNNWDKYVGHQRRNKLEFIGRIHRNETFTT